MKQPESNGCMDKCEFPCGMNKVSVCLEMGKDKTMDKEPKVERDKCLDKCPEVWMDRWPEVKKKKMEGWVDMCEQMDKKLGIDE